MKQETAPSALRNNDTTMMDNIYLSANYNKKGTAESSNFNASPFVETEVIPAIKSLKKKTSGTLQNSFTTDKQQTQSRELSDKQKNVDSNMNSSKELQQTPKEDIKNLIKVFKDLDVQRQ